MKNQVAAQTAPQVEKPTMTVVKPQEEKKADVPAKSEDKKPAEDKPASKAEVAEKAEARTAAIANLFMVVFPCVAVFVRCFLLASELKLVLRLAHCKCLFARKIVIK